MINLITGLPGNGKSLFAIGFIKQWADRENRPVFYSGVSLTEEGRQALGWTEIDALEWFKCPPGSIVYIDEAQRVFRPRMHGKEVPQHVAELETHRHAGMDLVLITQHPMLIDNEVRRLAGNHRHVVRMMGMERATIHEWTEVRQDCEKGSRREDSNKTVWPYDKGIYSLYKSAELHTVKRKIPKVVYLLALAPIVIGLAIWYMVHVGKKVVNEPNIPGAPSSSASGKSVQVPPGRISDKVAFDPVADAKQYVAVNTPRVQGLPHTAPKFDEITKPSAVPVPSSCIASSSKCLCYTQQGTRMDVRDQTCRDIVEYGYFQEFDPNGQQEKTARSVAVLDRQGPLPISGVSTQDRAPSFAVMPSDGYGVLGGRGDGVRVPGTGDKTSGTAKPV